MDESIRDSEGSMSYRRAGVEVRPSTPQERQEYLKEFQRVIDSLREKCGGFSGWWIIGGIARDALLDKQDFVVKSPQGRWRDVDVLFNRNNKNALDDLKSWYTGFLPVGGVSIQSFVDISEQVTLKRGALRIVVPQKVFETQMLRIGEIEFPSVSAQTLLHLYAVGDRPGRHMREKDFLNALDLAKNVHQHPESAFPERLYEGFHLFAKEKAKPSWTGTVRDLGVWYRNSYLNRIFPINSGLARKLVFHAFELLEGVELRHKSGKVEPHIQPRGENQAG